MARSRLKRFCHRSLSNETKLFTQGFTVISAFRADFCIINFVRLLNTLKYIHDKGIIHRDIKPENIILRDGDRLPVLIDFGAVKETMGTVTLGSGSMVSSVVIGTRGFMAPEQAAGRSVFSTDLYALGLTIIYAMTKKLPIEFETSHLIGELDWESDCPEVDPFLAKILNKAIKIELSGRYPTAEKMYEDLMKTVSTQPTTVILPQSNSNNINKLPNSQPKIKKISTLTSGSPNNNVWPILLALTCVMAVIGLGGGFLIMQQVNQAQLQTIQAQIAKEEAEKNRVQAEADKLQAEKDFTDAKTKQKELENRLEMANSQQPSLLKEDSYPGTSNNSNAAISRQDAVDLVKEWIYAKGDAFGPSYDRTRLGNFLTDRAYECNLKSVNWLQDNGAY